jgi:DNA-directed RNA polymerase specialized sigma24 family protein
MSARGEDRETQRNEAFTRLFDANWAAVRHHVEGVVEDPDEVTEIVSEIFLVAWSRLIPTKPMDRIWLIRAADRVLAGRSGRSTLRRTAIDAVHGGVSGDEVPPDLTMRARVLAALGVLTGRERRIIMLTYWDGLAVGEIAELLRSPRVRVRRKLTRAKAKLRAELGLEGAEAS